MIQKSSPKSYRVPTTLRRKKRRGKGISGWTRGRCVACDVISIQLVFVDGLIKIFPFERPCLGVWSLKLWVVQLEEILFGAFEDQPNWKLEQLRQYTKQPMVYLIALLCTILTYFSVSRSGCDKW